MQSWRKGWKIGGTSNNSKITYLTFNLGKETIYYIHTHHFYQKILMARIDFMKLAHLICSLTTNSKLCTVYLFTFRLHTNSLYAVYNRSVIWRPCATLGNCPSLNTQSCNRRPLCSTFTFENVRSPKNQFYSKKNSKKKFKRKKYILCNFLLRLL